MDTVSTGKDYGKGKQVLPRWEIIDRKEKNKETCRSGYSENLTPDGNTGYREEEGGRKGWKSGLGQIEGS